VIFDPGSQLSLIEKSAFSECSPQLSISVPPSVASVLRAYETSQARIGPAEVVGAGRSAKRTIKASEEDEDEEEEEDGVKKVHRLAYGEGEEEEESNSEDSNTM
jgi:hypothetical protein